MDSRRFIALLAAFTLGVTVLAEGFGIGVISTSFVKTLGKTLCLCLVAVAMDVVWGYCGILSLGHMAFFGIGGAGTFPAPRRASQACHTTLRRV